MDFFDLHRIGTDLVCSAAAIAVAYWFSRFTNIPITKIGWGWFVAGLVIFAAGYLQ